MTQTQEYWFARRFPLGNPRGAIGPIHWKGWALTAAFVLIMSLGAIAFAWFGAKGNMAEGIAIFVILAFIGGISFASMAHSKCDRIRTVADYKKDRQRV
jgi:hypothetical protein